LQAGRQRGIELAENEAETLLTIPLLGRIAAGRPIEAISGQETLNLGELIGQNRYALQVTGDSMIDAGILDGDTVILKHCNTANDGDIVAALIDSEEVTLKRLKRELDGSITLIAENSSMSPMHFAAGRVSVQGVVVGQLRRYQ